jgi:hypothetical protein
MTKDILEEIKEEDYGIVDFNLGAEENTNHDLAAVEQAGKLIRIGYMGVETEAYGCAYYQDGEPHYYISAKEETMDRFQRNSYLKGICPTPAKYYINRYDTILQSEEELKLQFRLETAFLLQKHYPPLLFEAINALTAKVSANSAFPIMTELCGQLESCFDMHQLKLFHDLTDMLYRGRLLTRESYFLMNQWYDKEVEKISVEPISSGNYKRTYSGFAYRKPDGAVKYFIDALPYNTREKQLDFIARGYLVTPILSIAYYSEAFTGLDNTRDRFKEKLEYYVGETYIKLMEVFKQLPASVDQELYFDYLAQIRQNCGKEAEQAFLYFGYLWNIKFDNA